MEKLASDYLNEKEYFNDVKQEAVWVRGFDPFYVESFRYDIYEYFHEGKTIGEVFEEIL